MEPPDDHDFDERRPVQDVDVYNELIELRRSVEVIPNEFQDVVRKLDEIGRALDARAASAPLEDASAWLEKVRYELTELRNSVEGIPDLVQEGFTMSR